MNKTKYIKNNGTFYPQDYVLKKTIIPFIPEFITPNLLTISRLVLTPFVLYLLLNSNYGLGLPLFIFAAFTDMLDGSIARNKDMITSWGIVADPIADKLLIGSVALLFLVKYLSIYLAIAVIGAEVITVGLGLIFKKKDQVVPSNVYGKVKFAFQVIGVLLVIFGAMTNLSILYVFSTITFILSLLLAGISLSKNIINPAVVKG